MSRNMIKIQDVSKEYVLGAIGGTTLREELQRTSAKLLKKEDPTRKVDAVQYSGHERFLALDGISFSVSQGETVGIIGHNGAGKSTLLKLLSRVTAPTNGDIYLNGRIASMLEVGTGFHPELTGRENIFMNGAILGMTKKEISSKLDEIIEFSECAKFIDTPVKRYSSGMYVKLAFSVAAHLDSEIMVMDEVLAVGDMKFQQKCLGRMDNAAHQDERTVLYVSHNMNTIRQLCSRCIVLDHGKMIFDGDVEKAIQIYMDANVMTFQKDIDFRKVKHLKSINSKGKAEIISVHVNDDSNLYISDDSMNLSFVILTKKSMITMRFMFILISRDNTVVGKTESEDFTLQEETNVVDISVPLDGISDGEYYYEINILYRNDLGVYEKYDGIPETLPFTIKNKIVYGIQGEEWKSRYWGHIMLKPIAINAINKYDCI